MFNSKCLVSITAAVALTMICAESAQAHRMLQRGYDPRSGRSFTTEVAHRHTRSGRIVLLDSSYSGSQGNGYGNRYGYGNNGNVLQQGILGAPTTTTYTTYSNGNPYSNSNYRYEDRGGYYRDNNPSTLGRVLQSIAR